MRWLSGCCVRSLSSCVTHEKSTHSPIPACAPRAPAPPRSTHAQSLELLSSFLAFASGPLLPWCMVHAHVHACLRATTKQASRRRNHQARIPYACLLATTHTHACMQTQASAHTQASMPNSYTCACTCVRVRACACACVKARLKEGQWQWQSLSCRLCMHASTCMLACTVPQFPHVPRPLPQSLSHL